MTYILGLNSFHGDSSACLLKDGEMLFAIEEERLRRVKHWAGFPSESIRMCLNSADVSLSDIHTVAVNQDTGAHLGRKIAYALFQRPDPRLLIDRLFNKRKRKDIRGELQAAFPEENFSGRISQVEHHVAHLASTYLVSPFEEAVAVSVDGFGDFTSTAWGLGHGTEVEVEDRIYFPHSLGIFYQALTQFLGFPNYGDEYKVMGLAPYGKPALLNEMREIVRLRPGGRFELDLRFFRHHKEKVSYEWQGGIPAVGTLYSDALAELLGPPRNPDEPLTEHHKDIAHSIQAMYEEAFFHLLNHLGDKHTGIENLTIAGGCGMNSVANGKVRLNTPFKHVYVQAAAGDAGGAIGAALHAWYELSPNNKTHTHAHAYWGPAFSNDEVAAVLAERQEETQSAGCEVTRAESTESLCQQVAKAITEGKVVGWFQGRMEWGPRALGNRSIVCDPRRSDIKDILNAKIKRRESFRPFAPSILDCAVQDWFEQDDDVPFMMQVYQIREDKRDQIPAVTHVDGSGRLQSVHQTTNPRYFALIEAFEQLTGVPMLLNTSFNENEPVVCQPQEALECFLRTNMDLLVIGDWIVERNG